MMIGVLGKIETGASSLVRVIGHVAAWSALGLVLLVGSNVLMRYLFSTGSVGLQEAEWHLMAVGALFGMSYGLNQGDEVRVDIFYAKMSPRMAGIIDLVSHLGLLIVALLIAHLSSRFAQASYLIGEGSPNPGGLPYRWLLKAALPVSFALLSVQALAMTLRSLMRVLRPTPQAEV